MYFIVGMVCLQFLISLKVLLIHSYFRWGEGGLSAKWVSLLFFDYFVQLFGVPKSVIHSRNFCFIAQFWYNKWQMLGTLVVLSLAYHPQTEGQAERQNRYIEQIIHCMVYKGSMDWLYAIPMREIAINYSIQDSTGLSPVYIVYRTPIRMPVDMLNGV